MAWRSVLRSVLPATLILMLAAVTAVAMRSLDRRPAVQPWQPPDGFEQVHALVTPDGIRHELWLGGGCWYLAEQWPSGSGGAWGGCGGTPGEPWIVYSGGVVAGRLMPHPVVPTTAAVSARIDGRDLPLARGGFLAAIPDPGTTATLEFHDRDGLLVARFEDVPVGGSR